MASSHLENPSPPLPSGSYFNSHVPRSKAGYRRHHLPLRLHFFRPKPEYGKRQGGHSQGTLLRLKKQEKRERGNKRRTVPAHPRS